LKFDEFIEHYLGAREGSIRCYQTGKVLGQHRGLWFHTIGQRKGLGPHLVSVVHNGPWYVAAKEAETNTLYVTNNLEVIDRPRVEFRVHKINWVSGIEPEGLDGEGIVMNFKLRHGPTLSRGRVFRDTLSPNIFSADKENVGEESPEGTESKGKILRVILDVKDKGIAPGQFAAFYKDSECLGAGIIADTAIDEIHRQEEHLTAVKTKKSFSSQN
jgi:tRNA U34 2-thiouridine synthase MnmA/TrmU